MEVVVERLRKDFGATRAVDDVSFSFGAGEIVGFVGPNGAGKTTTMRMLATVDEPTSGAARVNGVSIVEEPEKARALVGYVPDALPGHRDISVHEYLDFFARAYGQKGAARRGVVATVEEFTGLTGLREKMITALSKGMKQRVSVARALLHDPPVLLLDEPAAGLDPRARIELRELLKALAARGKAILISSHILTELAEVCTGALIIERGRILRSGSLTDILAADLPRRTVSLRALGAVEDLYREVSQAPLVIAARLSGGEVEAEVDGGDEAIADLLAHLLARGVRVIELKQERANLEELFMSVTGRSS